MAIKLALAGNPNCGKTTMFNDLTGSSQYVGNWPGVTVEKKEGKLRGHQDVIVTDLPGIYSLSPYTLEEVVTRDYIMNEHPYVVINLMDALAASLKARTGEDAGEAKASSSTEGGKAPKPKRKPPAKRAG